MSLVIDRANNRVANTNLASYTGSFTFEAWFNITSFSDTQHGAVFGVAGGLICGNYFNGGGQNKKPLLLTVVGGTGRELIGSVALTADTWYYGRWTHDTSSGDVTFKIWDSSFSVVDSGTANHTVGARGASANAHIGSVGDGSNIFDGPVRNVWLKSSVTTSDADSTNRAALKNPQTCGADTATYFWRLQDNTDINDLVDSSNLTLTNSPTSGSDPSLNDCVFYKGVAGIYF